MFTTKATDVVVVHCQSRPRHRMLGPREGGSVMRQRSHRVRFIVAMLSGLLAIAGIFIPATAQASGNPLIPSVDCVWTSDPVGPLVFFNYENLNATVTIPASAKNFMKGSPKAGPKNLGQPTTFSPGKTFDAFAVALSSANPSATMTWTIKGPDGVVRRAGTSIAAGPLCATEPFSPSITTMGGLIGSQVTQQKYASNLTTLIGAKVKFALNGFTTTCVGGWPGR